MRALILCAGKATRWKDFGGIPKQLVEVLGEPVLHRTVRQLRERGCADVQIIVRDPENPVWQVTGAKAERHRPVSGARQANKVLDTRHLWSGRTLLLFGDVFFTDAAMDAIVGNADDWQAFARFDASQLTGNDHRELFGFAVTPPAYDRLEAAARRCVDIHRRGLMGGWSGGWQIYAAMTGAPDDEVGRKFLDRGHITEIDDWTDDFDRPEDWHRWCRGYAQASPQDRERVLALTKGE